MMAVNDDHRPGSWALEREAAEGTLIQPAGDQIDVVFTSIDGALAQLDFAGLVLLQMPFLLEKGLSAESREAVRSSFVQAARHLRDANDAFNAACEIASCRGQA